MVKKLKSLGYWVRGADIKYPDFSMSQADEFLRGDLTEQSFCDVVTNTEFDEIYQFAADMGGAGYIFTGEHDADVMNNSATINLNILEILKIINLRYSFHPLRVCTQSTINLIQTHQTVVKKLLTLLTLTPRYGWEKLFSGKIISQL